MAYYGWYNSKGQSNCYWVLEIMSSSINVFRSQIKYIDLRIHYNLIYLKMRIWKCLNNYNKTIHIQSEMCLNIIPVKVLRINIRSDYCRPLNIILPEATDVFSILKSTKKQLHSHYSYILCLLQKNTITKRLF